MTTIFLSYRRNDSADATGRIHEHLLKRVSAIHVFKDVDNIPYGADFLKVINKALQETDVLLAIIGPAWLESKNKDGTRRILDTADYVRVELETAFNNGIRVIPVLVGNATMPSAEDLPDSIRQLAMCNAASVRPDPDFQTDLQRLAAAIGGKRRSFAWICVAVLLVISAAIGYFGFGGNSPNSKRPASPAVLADRDITEELLPLINLGTEKEGFIYEFNQATPASLRPKVVKLHEAARKVQDSLRTHAQRFALDETTTFSQLQSNLEKKQLLFNQLLKEIDESTFDVNRADNLKKLTELRDELIVLVNKYSEYLKKRETHNASDSSQISS